MWGWFKKIKLLNAVVMVRVPVADSSFMIIWKRTRQMTGFRLTWKIKNNEFWQTSSQKGKWVLWKQVRLVSVESILNTANCYLIIRYFSWTWMCHYIDKEWTCRFFPLKKNQLKESNNNLDCSRAHIEGLGIHLLLISNSEVRLGSWAPENEYPTSYSPLSMWKIFLCDFHQKIWQHYEITSFECMHLFFHPESRF